MATKPGGFRALPAMTRVESCRRELGNQARNVPGYVFDASNHWVEEPQAGVFAVGSVAKGYADFPTLRAAVSHTLGWP